MSTCTASLPAKLEQVFAGRARYRCAYGGRGGAKSESFGEMLLIRGLLSPLRILCTRELQASIRDSVHHLLVRLIDRLGLGGQYRTTEQAIYGANGTEIIFKGLRHNIAEIKSLSGIDICWIEEAEALTEESAMILFPTIREEGSEIWLTWNPRLMDAFVQRFFIDAPPASARIARIGWQDNPWFPKVLDDERLLLLARDPQLYAHVWEGAFLPPGVGAAFPEISRDIHEIDEADPPDRLHRVFDFERMTPRPGIHIFRSLDWGYARPFSVGWYFADHDSRLYRYREFYGANSERNEGITMVSSELADRIREIEASHNERVLLSVADASIWDKPSNQNVKAERLPSVAETMEAHGVYFDRRVSIDAKKSRAQGKQRFHEYLAVDADGLPHLQVFKRCKHWWRTVPALPKDELDPEDVDTEAEDHAYDETRYMLSARPWRSVVALAEIPYNSVTAFYREIDRRRAVTV